MRFCAAVSYTHLGALEKPCILKNHTEETAEIAASHVTDIVTVNPDAAAVDIVKAHEKFYDGGFACTRRSNDAVSYTHLDVYKRQLQSILNVFGCLNIVFFQ